MAKGKIRESQESSPDLPSAEQLDEIRRRAYELYEARGGEEGHDLEDWNQAEAEILGNRPSEADR
jgi:hypothetical protein